MIKNTKDIVLLIVLLQLLSLFGYSQDIDVFSRVDVPGDISQSIVYCIEQDSFGNIWAGTEEGVLRFNSKELFLYNKYKGLPYNFSNRISAIFIDNENSIWIGTEKGISLYFPEKNKFELIKTTDSSSLDLVEFIVSGTDNDILIGDYNGLWKYNNQDNLLENLIQNKTVLSIEITLDGNYILGTNTGLYYYNSVKKNIIQLQPNIIKKDFTITEIAKIGDNYYLGTLANGLYLLNENMDSCVELVIPVFSDKYFRINSILKLNRKIAIGTDGAGLIYLDKSNNFVNSSVNNVNNPNSISSNGVYDIIYGRDNIIWIATYGGGINKSSINSQCFRNKIHIINEKNSLAHNLVRAIKEDSKGNIWFGTKKGLSIWNRERKMWNHINTFSKSSETIDIILALEEDGDFMWVATYGSGVFKVNKNDYTSIQYGPHENSDVKIGLSKVYTLLKDRNGSIWLGGNIGPVQQISPLGEVQQFAVTAVKKIIQLDDGSICAVGRMGAQIIKDGRIKLIEELRSGNNNLDYTDINCIVQNTKGNLILGTNGDGLVFFNFSTNTVKKLNLNNGMPSDIIQGIVMKNDSSLWVSTTRGLAHISFDKIDTNITIYNKNDGLISNEFNYGSSYLFSDGTIAFGGTDGVTLFKPQHIKIQKRVPTVVFEDFKLFKKKETSNENIGANINNLEKLKLKYIDNSFNIKFAGIHHIAPSKVLYSWKMEGLSNIWSEPSSETQINFINLSPGNYKFYVKASNRDGFWSKNKTVQIFILPPWWKTNLAYFFYFILGLIVLAGLIYTINLFIIKRNAEEQINFFNSITHELKTPLTILLSTLESIPKSIENTSIKKIRSTSRQLINLFEQLLNFHLASSGNQKSQTIEEIALMPHLTKVVDGFKPLLVEKSIKVDLIDNWNEDYFYYDKYILDKILFNLLSNAVKYSKENGSIKIILDRKKDFVVITFKDDGIGIPQDQQKNILKKYYRGRNAINSQLPGTGLGLMIVKNLIDKDKGSISFSSVENEGTTFTVSLKDKKILHKKNNLIENLSEQFNLATDEETLAEFSDSKILVVEDNNELRQNLVSWIGTHFQVYEAENGKVGLEMALDVFPDLIITDLIMPEMDGLEMSKALQNDINLSHIPIVMMTVLTSQKQKLESVESGVTTYLEKPVDYNYLLAKVINSLGWSKKLREKYLHQVDVENAEKFRNKKDAEFINNLELFVLKKIIEENLSVYDLCKFVGMSRTALYMKLKNMVDLSPQNFIIHTRLKFARKKLLEGEISIKEVAYKSGFSSPKYFSTSFKKLFGESPTAFVKKLQN